MAAIFSAPTPLLVLHIVITDAVGANYDYTTTRGIRLIEARGYKGLAAGGAGDSIRVLSTADPITDAMSLNVVANVIFQSATVDSVFSTFATGDTLRITMAQNTDNGCFAALRCLPA